MPRNRKLSSFAIMDGEAALKALTAASGPSRYSQTAGRHRDKVRARFHQRRRVFHRDAAVCATAGITDVFSWPTSAAIRHRHGLLALLGGGGKKAPKAT